MQRVWSPISADQVTSIKWPVLPLLGCLYGQLLPVTPPPVDSPQARKPPPFAFKPQNLCLIASSGISTYVYTYALQTFSLLNGFLGKFEVAQLNWASVWKRCNLFMELLLRLWWLPCSLSLAGLAVGFLKVNQIPPFPVLSLLFQMNWNLMIKGSLGYNFMNACNL